MFRPLAALLVLASPLLAADPWVTLDPPKDAKGVGVGKHVVLVSGDEEYRSEEMMPALAKILTTRHGFKTTTLFAIDPKDGTVNPNVNNNIPGLEVLKSADLLVLFVRMRDLPDEQMKHIVDYVESGKPVVGLRTATHAFQLSSKTYAKYHWQGKEKGYEQGFGKQVLGETWVSHHGNHKEHGTRGVVAKGEEKNPILKGIEAGSIFGTTDVYGVNLPLKDCTPLVMGEVTESLKPDSKAVVDKPEAKKKFNDPMMPVAWTKAYTGSGGKAARVFATTMGCAEDFTFEGTRRLFVNGCLWALGLEDNIPDKTDVELLGEFKPSKYGFKDRKDPTSWKPGKTPADYFK
jgi:type 1 glutamine amidotransferase